MNENKTKNGSNNNKSVHEREKRRQNIENINRFMDLLPIYECEVGEYARKYY